MRLIDADALDREMYRKSFEVDDGRNVWNSGLWIRYKIFEEAIRDAPTVDAVPVIRCKDCKYWQLEHYVGGQGMSCQMDNSDDVCLTEPTHFCALAERKEE